MSLGAIFDIAGMGMTAQSIRLNTTASNLANAQSAGNEESVYRSRHPIFETVQRQALGDQLGMPSIGQEAGAGIRVTDIVENDAPLPRRYEPQHPQADEEGYVFYSDINVVEEMADMISASRSFQMNVEVMQTTKTMMQSIMRLGQ